MSKIPFTRIIEDAAVVAGTAVSTWQATGNVTDVVTAVSSAPLVRSALALAVSGGHSSGLVEAVSILRKVYAAFSAAAAAQAPSPVSPANPLA